MSDQLGQRKQLKPNDVRLSTFRTCKHHRPLLECRRRTRTEFPINGRLAVLFTTTTDLDQTGFLSTTDPKSKVIDSTTSTGRVLEF
eukprot:scaffold1551_cov108-Cylindrotheca_fusiformis.AAC.2